MFFGKQKKIKNLLRLRRPTCVCLGLKHPRPLKFGQTQPNFGKQWEVLVFDETTLSFW